MRARSSGVTTADAKETRELRRRVKLLEQENSMVGSMGNIGTAADNAAMESLFSLLQNNVLDTRRWDTCDQFRIAVVTWIEHAHHRRRRKAALGRLTPEEYETITHPPAGLAAPSTCHRHPHRTPLSERPSALDPILVSVRQIVWTAGMSSNFISLKAGSRMWGTREPCTGNSGRGWRGLRRCADAGRWCRVGGVWRLC